MRILTIVAALLCLGSSLSAQVRVQTSGSLTGTVADTTIVRASGVDTVKAALRVTDAALAAQIAALTRAVDSLRAAPPVVPPVVPPDTTPTPPVPPVTPPDGGFPNAPAGLVTVADCDFAATWTGGSGTLACPVGRITVTDWDRGGRPSDQCRTIDDPTASDRRSWESHYDNGAGGSGPCALDISFGARDTVYIAIRVKYSAGWQENTNSQKVIYVNTTQGAHTDLFDFRYRAESVGGITSATGCEALESNVASVAVKSPPESSPCQGQRATYITPGVWSTYEYLWIASSGTVKWWKDGQPRGSHTGRNIGRMDSFQLPDTWGGGGTLNQEQSRYYDRVTVRVSAR